MQAVCKTQYLCTVDKGLYVYTGQNVLQSVVSHCSVYAQDQFTHYMYKHHILPPVWGIWNTANVSIMPVDERYSGPLTATYIASHMKSQPSASSHGQMVKLANMPTSSQLKGNWHIGHIGILKAGLKHCRCDRGEGGVVVESLLPLWIGPGLAIQWVQCVWPLLLRLII